MTERSDVIDDDRPQQRSEDRWEATTAGPSHATVGAKTPSPLSSALQWARRYLRAHPVTALETLGAQAVMGAQVMKYLVIDIAKRRFPFGEFVQQAAFMVAVASVPTLLVTIPMGVTMAVEFSLLAGQVGATSLSGAATGLAIIRQGASLVAAMMLAAAVGSAIASDLGSRTMREEIDAMEVMGVSAVRRLVIPRVAAAILVGVALTGWTCFVGFLAGYSFNVFMQDGTPGSFVSTFASFATVGDMAMALVKSVIFAAIVAVISCQKGLTTRGGPAGVANSVNAAVVEAILLLMIVNVVISQMYIIVFPRETL